MKTIDIELAVIRYFRPRQNLIVPNVSWGMNMHECDMLIITANNYGIEVEIKVSKSDLIADGKKRHHHYDNRIKRLYFAIPDNLRTSADLIPSEAGILVIGIYKGLWVCKKIREARIKSGYKFSAEERYQIARLGTMRIWTLKQKIRDLEAR